MVLEEEIGCLMYSFLITIIQRLQRLRDDDHGGICGRTCGRGEKGGLNSLYLSSLHAAVMLDDVEEYRLTYIGR